MFTNGVCRIVNTSIDYSCVNKCFGYKLFFSSFLVSKNNCMNFVLPAWLIEIAHKGAKIPYVKSLFKPLYYSFKQVLEKKRNDNFHKYSLNALKSFDKCLSDAKIPYTLIFGSLLGAVREGGFIKHDLDIDVALYINDRTSLLYKILKEEGFKLIRRFVIDDGMQGCEETFEYKNTGVTLDIFYICPPIDKYPYCCCWNKAEGCSTYRESVKKIGGVYPRRIDQPVKKEMRRVPFETISVSITTNAHECLEFAYGPNYMIPDPNFIPPVQHRYVWYEKLANVEFFEGYI